MKKIISLVLAFAMMFAVCIPAFASVTNDGSNIIFDTDTPYVTPQSDSSSVIKTTTSGLPSADGYFTVTFPAATDIAWETASTDIAGCKYESHLVYGKSLKITVAPSALGKMTATNTAITTQIAYTIGGDMSVTAASPVVYPAKTFTPKVLVDASEWNKAVVGEYTDNLTFTVEVI